MFLFSMKKRLLLLSSVVALLSLLLVSGHQGGVFVASAAPTSTIVQNLRITGLGSTGNPCLIITGLSGAVATTTCAASGGGTATTSIAGLTDSTFVIRSTSTIGISTSTSPSTIWIGPDQTYLTAALTSLNGLTGATQTFSTSSDTNLAFTITSAGTDHLFTPFWVGTLADSRITSATNWNSKATSSINLTAGVGLTGGGDLTGANRDFAVGAGTGITVNANDVALTIPVVVSSGGTGTTTFPNGLVLANGSAPLTALNSIQTCGANQFVNYFAATGTIGCASLAGGGITSLNSQTGTSQTFASSGPALVITSSGDVHTFALATSTASVTGALSAADWNTFNGKANVNSYVTTTITGSTYLNASASTGAVTLTNLGVQSLTAGAGISLSSATGTITATNKIGSSTIAIGGTTLTSGKYTIATSGPALSATGSGSTITLNLPTSTAAITGVLSKTDWATFNGKSSTTITGSTHLNASAASGAVTLTNLGVTSIVASSSVTVSSATGTVTIAMRPQNIPWTIEAATGTLATTASCTSSFCLDHIYTFDSTSTIAKIRGKNKTQGDTIDFNFWYGPAQKGANATTSLFALFSAFQTNTATSTPTIYTSFSSSTPNLGDMLWVGYKNASSSQFHWDTYFNYQ